MSERDFVASRDELKANGFGQPRVKNWIRSGRLVGVLKSVYSYGRDIESAQALRRAALLAAGPGSALIGRSACEVWGLVKPCPGLPKLICVGSSSGQARELTGLSPRTRRSKVKVAKRSFEAGDLSEMNGLAIAAPAMALLDFAIQASTPELRFAFLEACRLKLFEKADLVYCAQRFPGRRGAKRLRPFLALWVPELLRIRSVLEGWFLLEWIERGHAIPRVNVKLFGWEVDFFWPEFDLVLEVDGDAFHNNPIQKQIDREKQNDLEARGLTVIRLSFREFAVNPGAAIDYVADTQRQISLRRSA